MVNQFLCVPVISPLNIFVTSRGADSAVLAAEIQDKTTEDVEKYLKVFNKKCKTLAEYPRIRTRVEEGEAKRNKRENLETLLSKKIESVRYPMQELEFNYPATKGKVYSEEEADTC